MIKMSTSKNCAWRAAYFYHQDKQIAHLGIDPNLGYGNPRLFGGIGGKRFNVKVPYLAWKYNSSKLRSKLYQIQNNLLFRMDGRGYYHTSSIK